MKNEKEKEPPRAEENTQEKASETNRFSAVWEKASTFGKQVVGDVQKGAKDLSQKVQQDNYDRRLKKYNPLYQKEFKRKTFDLPNVIHIVDNSANRDVDVLQGAMGWREMINDTEVLHIYENYVTALDAQFIPNAQCGELYYTDHFNENRFVRIDRIFGKAHEEKLAELEHIAFYLGAKRCAIELIEANSYEEITAKISDIQAGALFKKFSAAASASSNRNSSKSQSDHRSGCTITTFEGNSTPRHPKLKWFADDEGIRGLIEMRCSGDNSIRSRILKLSGSSTATMSESIARTIDIAIWKIGLKTSTKMETNAKKEHLSFLLFDIEF